MPRDTSKSNEITSKNCRYSPFERRSPSEMPTPPTSPPPPVPAIIHEERVVQVHHMHRCPEAQNRPMANFHAKVVEILNSKVEQKELELVSDAETLTADEGSDSSRDSWNNGGYASVSRSPPLDFGFKFRDSFPRAVVEPMPKFEPLEEPMEIVVDDELAEDESDEVSENSSCWDSDEDEEIQRAFNFDSGVEADQEYDSDGAESRNGRANIPDVFAPLYYPGNLPPSPDFEIDWVGVASAHPLMVHWPAPLEHLHQLAAPYWPVGRFEPPPLYEQAYWPVAVQPAEPLPLPEQPVFVDSPELSPRYTPSPVEFMDQDDDDEGYAQCQPEQIPVDYRVRAQPQPEPVQYFVQNEREANYYYPRYGLRNELARLVDRPQQDIIQPRQELVPMQNQVAAPNHNVPPFRPNRSGSTDFSVDFLLSSKRK